MPTTWLPPTGWRVSRTAWAAGSAVRRAYARALPQVVARPMRPSGRLPFDVLSFSCERDLPEQVASLRALLGRAGRPERAAVVSDGTHTPRSRALLERVDPCVRVVDWTALVRPDLPPAVLSYAAASAMGKKLAVEVSLPRTRPLLYVDSDVLVLPGAGAPLREELEAALHRGTPSYLLDPEDVYLDSRLLGPGELTEPLNAGLLVLPTPLDWRPALSRLAALDGAPEFHSEQTLVHLTVRAAGGRPLDPARWVVASDDMPDRRDRHRGPEVVVRHYTTPVRHKFWLAVLASSGAKSSAAPDAVAATSA
jgi:hypothetical protein